MTDEARIPLVSATFKLDLVEWEDRPHCLYLNDFRIAGGKPWGGGKIIKTWKVSRADLLEAMGRKS